VLLSTTSYTRPSDVQQVELEGIQQFRAFMDTSPHHNVNRNDLPRCIVTSPMFWTATVRRNMASKRIWARSFINYKFQTCHRTCPHKPGTAVLTFGVTTQSTLQSQQAMRLHSNVTSFLLFVSMLHDHSRLQVMKATQPEYHT